jgi:hypothetical protein
MRLIVPLSLRPGLQLENETESLHTDSVTQMEKQAQRLDSCARRVFASMSQPLQLQASTGRSGAPRTRVQSPATVRKANLSDATRSLLHPSFLSILICHLNVLLYTLSLGIVLRGQRSHRICVVKSKGKLFVAQVRLISRRTLGSRQAPSNTPSSKTNYETTTATPYYESLDASHTTMLTSDAYFVMSA